MCFADRAAASFREAFGSLPSVVVRADDAQEEKAYALAKEVARKALNRQLKDRTGGALYFHHRKVSPKWSAEYMKTTELGEHLFYKPPGKAAK